MTKGIQIDCKNVENGIFKDKDWSYTFKEGLTVLTGVNGCGKTKLLQAIKESCSAEKLVRFIEDELPDHTK